MVAYWAHADSRRANDFSCGAQLQQALAFHPAVGRSSPRIVRFFGRRKRSGLRIESYCAASERRRRR